MIRASSLRGRAVVDLDAAQKIGNVDEVILDPDGRRVAALAVTRGQAMLGGGQQTLVAASAVHAVGKDAITVNQGQSSSNELANVGSLPRLSQVTGRKLITHGGRLLGSIGDVLIDTRNGKIIGYTCDGEAGGFKIENLFGGPSQSERPNYVRADADLRVGPDLVVVPDDAYVRADGVDEHRLNSIAEGSETAVTNVEWSGGSARSSTGENVWTQPDEAAGDVDRRFDDEIRVAPTAEPVAGFDRQVAEDMNDVDRSEEAARINATIGGPAPRTGDMDATTRASVNEPPFSQERDDLTEVVPRDGGDRFDSPTTSPADPNPNTTEMGDREPEVVVLSPAETVGAPTGGGEPMRQATVDDMEPTRPIRRDRNP